MATRPLATGRRIAKPDWRAVLKRSLRRASELTGALALFIAMIFLALSLASYHQTDPSLSTAAGGDPQNWMGQAGAWTADFALMLFGPVSFLFVPLLYVFARKLWRLVEEDDGNVEPVNQRWWRPTFALAAAMVLISTVLSLGFTQQGGILPASMGGVSGLLGAKGIHAITGFLPEAIQGWVVFGLSVVCLFTGTAMAGKVFAFDWGILFSLPGKLGRVANRRPAADGREPAAIHKPAEPSPYVATPVEPDTIAPPPEASLPWMEDKPRKAPEIAEPSKPAPPAQLSKNGRQKDFLDQYQLPAIELLRELPADSQKPIDKLRDRKSVV